MPDNARSDDNDQEGLPLATRLWFAWVAFLRILFDAAFAARAFRVREAMPALPAVKPAKKPARDTTALVMLALFQREGRLIDFLEQDITSFDDAEVGAAARVVHEGCGKALHGAAKVEPLRDEEEDAKVVIERGYDAAAVKLTGNVSGKPPYRGTVRHRGWRVHKLELPRAVAGHDVTIVAPAEIEVS